MRSLPSPVMRAARYGGWLLLGGLLYLYLNLFSNALIDDAFISLRYVKTLLASGTWGFFPGVVANSATSPLNVILLASLGLLIGPTAKAALWLYVVCLLCLAWLLARLARHATGSETFGWLAISALVFNPLLVSTIGLESIVFTTLFVLALYCCEVQKWTGMAIALALLTLTRPEGALFFLVFLPFVPGTKTKMRASAAFVLCLAPWYLYSWTRLGSFVPDTFFIKTEQATWYQWDFFNGIPTLYYRVYPLGTLLSFAFLPLVSLLLSRRLRENRILVIVWLAGTIHFVGYSLLTVPPFHWYYVPQVITIILLGSLALGIVYRNSTRLWQRRIWAGVTVVYFLAPALGMGYMLGRQGFIVSEMPIHSNWGTHEQYREIGLWLKEHHEKDTIRLVAGEIGTLSYYCDCRLLDRFSDRSWLGDGIARRTSQPGIVPVLWKANFAFYSNPRLPPHDYSLRAFFAEPEIRVEMIKEWQTSTRWIPQGFLILSRE